MKRLLLTIVAITVSICIWAQTSKQFVTVVAEPDHSDWTYSVGQTAKITLYAIKENARIPNAEITYSYGPEKLKAVYEGKVTTDKNGEATIKVPGAKKPGFVTVKASTQYDGDKYSSMTNLAFDPQDIRPTTTLPDDFVEFWENAKKKAAAVPMEVSTRWSEKESNNRVDVYYVKIQSYRRGNYVYGVLSVPKTEGRKPAVLRLPGAAIRPFNGPNSLAYDGFVTLEIGVHGIPVDQDPEIYRALGSGPLGDYPSIGLDNRDNFYYKRVYLGCIRAIDYLCSRDDVDPERIATYGGSQGGMLSIVTAALDPRVKALFAYFPAFCDVTGYHEGRSGGWPHLFMNPDEKDLEKKIAVSKYFDTVNFARFIKVPGIYAWGYNDITCCPTSTYSAYNVITAPKELHVARDTGHWLYPWQSATALKWLKNQFGMSE